MSRATAAPRPTIAISEKEWMHAVADIARTWHWKVAHFRAGQTGRGWRTPVAFDGAGFPDLVLVHPNRRRVIFAELKSDRGRLEEHQDLWRDWLICAGAQWRVWQPRDRPAVVDELSFHQAVAVL